MLPKQGYVPDGPLGSFPDLTVNLYLNSQLLCSLTFIDGVAIYYEKY